MNIENKRYKKLIRKKENLNWKLSLSCISGWSSLKCKTDNTVVEGKDQTWIPRVFKLLLPCGRDDRRFIPDLDNLASSPGLWVDTFSIPSVTLMAGLTFITAIATLWLIFLDWKWVRPIMSLTCRTGPIYKTETALSGSFCILTQGWTNHIYSSSSCQRLSSEFGADTLEKVENLRYNEVPRKRYEYIFSITGIKCSEIINKFAAGAAN